jgi:4-hydroxyphenylacetate 3-monooxygenase
LLFRLVWDLTGSEFAGRQEQYERFYAGASHVVRGHNHREAPWSAFAQNVERLVALCREPSIVAPRSAPVARSP